MRHNFDEILAKIDALEPTTGEGHERNMHELQEYNIKALVGLIEETERLNAQNQDLSITNLKLQRQIFWLTVVMGTLAVLTFLFDVLDFLGLYKVGF